MGLIEGWRDFQDCSGSFSRIVKGDKGAITKLVEPARFDGSFRGLRCHRGFSRKLASWRGMAQNSTSTLLAQIPPKFWWMTP